MECFICGGEANRGETTGDYQRVACPACGDYKMTGSALAEMEKHGFRFNIEVARQWIAMHQGTGEIPMINAATAVKLI